MTLNTKRSKVLSHLRCVSTPKFQFSLRFALQPDVFKLQANLRYVHRMTSKWHWILKDQRYPIYMLQLDYPRLPNFGPFSSTSSHFLVTSQSETSALNDFQMTLNTKRSNITQVYKMYKYPRVLNFSSFRSTVGLFPDAGYLETSAPNDPQNNLKYKKGQRYPIHVI